MTLAAEPQTWEDVLAEVEADVARTEEMLRANTAASETMRVGPLAAAETMLPASMFPASIPRLPDPATMPPVAPDLLPRIAQLRDRIFTLGQELLRALSEIEDLLAAPRQMLVVPVRPAPTPRLVDRAL